MFAIKLIREFIIELLLNFFKKIIPKKLDDLHDFFVLSNTLFILFLGLIDLIFLHLLKVPKFILTIINLITLVGFNNSFLLLLAVICSAILLQVYTKYGSQKESIFCNLIFNLNLMLYIFLGVLFVTVLSIAPLLITILIASLILVSIGLFKILKLIFKNKYNLKISFKI